MSDPESDVIYLSYSGWTMYDICPQQYKWKYIDGLPAETDVRTSLFGKAFGRVFELFYEREMWRKPDPVKEAMGVVFESIKYAFEDNKFVPDRNLDVDFCRQLREDIIKYIPHGINIIRKYKLLSESTRTELKLDATYKSDKYDFSIRMGGRADFVHGMREPYILDGKGGSKANINNFQLIWYATQYYLKYHVAPARLGYIFWKYEDEPLVWVDYAEHDIRHCVKQVYQHAKSIRLKVFQPKPSNNCKLCGYKKTCKEGKNYLASMPIEKGRVNITNSIFQIDDV